MVLVNKALMYAEDAKRVMNFDASERMEEDFDLGEEEFEYDEPD
jgi:hypothetical protein